MKTKRIYPFISVLLTLTLFTQTIAATFFPAQVLAISLPEAGPTAVASPSNDLPRIGEDLLPAAVTDYLSDPEANELPEGVLMDIGATEMSINNLNNEPAALANPISLARVQSAYVPGNTVSNTLIITFTVSNNRPPTFFPTLPESATITETIAVLNDFDFNADPNTISNVVLADTLTNDAIFVDGSPEPDQKADDFVFNLGDIPPMSSVTANFRIAVPASVPDFIDLDAGATAYGSLQGRMVSAATAPATLAPDSFADYLGWTPDADIYDSEMLQKASELGSDPTKLFEFVRSLDYESYQGSLRGTRGTLWSEAGNSLDQANLLIAMLRAGGVPARYVRGNLNTPLAQELILSMFPEPVEVIGHIPSGTDVSDPANDPDLLAETQDHWWVEAYIDGQWLSLDPTFARAQPGDAFATAVDTAAEAPDDQRHKVTLHLKVERYTLLSAATGDVEITYPLTATFNTVELVGRPVTLNHLVNSSGGGAVFTLIDHTYVPYFIVGDYEKAVEGDAYQDIFSNFAGGLGNIFTTGAWLQIESTDPAGNIESYEREIKDLIGPAVRQAGGTIDLSETRPDTSLPLFGPSDAAQIHVLPQNQANPRPLQQQWTQFVGVMPETIEIYEQLSLLDPNDPAASAGFANEASFDIQRMQILTLDSMQDMYSVSAQGLRNFYSDALLTQSYVAAPKFIFLSQSFLSDSVETSFELLNVRQRIIPSPGQNMQAAWLTQMMQSIGDKAVETDLLQQLANNSDHTLESAFLVIEAALEADIEIVLVTQETLDLLDSLNISEQAKARITKALLADDTLAIQVPREMVLLDGRPQIGWEEIDMETGYVAYVYENGRRASFIDTIIAGLVWTFVQGVQFTLGVFAVIVSFGLVWGLYSLTYFEECTFLSGALSYSCFKTAAVIAAIMAASTITGFSGGLCATSASPSFCLGLAAGVATMWSIAILFEGFVLLANDPPLPGALIRSPRANDSENFDTAQHFFSQTQPAGSIEGALTTPLTQLSGQTNLAWTDSTTSHAFTFSNLSATSATLYQDGIVLAQGTVQIEPPALIKTAVLQGTNVTVAASGEGRQTFFAPALPGLGAGSGWQDYTAVLSAGQPYTLTLADADITVNGIDEYNGDFTLVADSPTNISGSGHTAVPNFAPTLDGQLQDGRLLTGPTQGSFLVDGQPLDVSNGVAIAGYTGPVTLTEITAASDQIDFAGEADFFSLHLTGPATTDPSTPINLTPAIEANFSDEYTLTVAAPAGWNVVIEDNGSIIATPPPGAAPDNYLILVTAQSSTYPDLFVSAFHTVTTTAFEGMALTVTEDPLITVPMGPVLEPEAVLPGVNGHIDNGRAEIPEAAYTIYITNSATISHPYDITVSGLPDGWLVLSGAAGQTSTNLSLPPGGTGQAGLYISPTVSTILAPGTSYTLDITASTSDGSGLSESQTIVWTMPATPFPYLQLEPALIYALPDSTTAVDLQLANVGNSDSTFAITNTAKADIYGSQPYMPGHSLTVTPTVFTTPNLGSSQTSQQQLQVDTSGTLAGEQFLLTSQSAAGAYQPSAYALVQIVSPITWPIFEAATETATSCTLGEPGLSPALENLAQAVNNLETSCADGSCSLAARDQVVASLNGVVTYAAPTSHLVTADTTLQTIAAEMATHSSDAELEADMNAISTAVGDLANEVCELSEHRPHARFSPYLDAVLLGETAAFSLTVTNEGTQMTSYTASVNTPSGDQTFNPTLAPGETAVLPVSTTPAALGSYDLTAEVIATGPEVQLEITETAVARLHVVDKFVQVTAVSADPPFVESGTSATSLAVAVSNVANVARPATARATILAPDGSISYTSDIPLTLLVGPPRLYELETVDTSGWAEGVYTITVELLDAAGNLIPDGSGLGTLGVGQALTASHVISPAIVPPGTITVTTVITTEVQDESETLSSAPAAATLNAWPERPVLIDQSSVVIEQSSVNSEQVSNTDSGGMQLIRADRLRLPLNEIEEDVLLLTTGAITRTEDSTAAVTYSGVWTAVTDATADHASLGDYHTSQTPGDSASFSFSGTWAAVGFTTGSASGQAELFVDGASQGVVDLYSRSNDVRRVTLSNLADTKHVISATITGQQNPFSSNTQVGLDYFDTWDGTDMDAGTFEQDDGRVWLSDGWVNQNEAGASGGSYYRAGHTAWLPFTGDAITFQAVTHANSEKIALYIDDDFRGYYDLAAFNVHTQTFTFDGLGDGPHVLTLRAYRGQATIDTFTVPATEPATPPPVIGSYHRYEENDLALLYNGFPFPQTGTSWSSGFNDVVSDHYLAYSGSAGDTVQFTFTGTAVTAGFYASTNGGFAELFVDGVSQGLIDTYQRTPTVLPFSIGGLADTTHTLSVTVLGQANPLAGNDLVQLDYVDVWDGTPLPDGTFEELDERVYRSYRWSLLADPQASDGQYLQDAITGAANVWFPFNGESFTFRAIAGPQGSRTTKMILDGQLLASLNLYNSTAVSRTFSFNNLGPGLHLLHLERYRGELSLDAFTTPGIPPFRQTSVYTGIVRYEEDDPSLLYNGSSFTRRPQSWSEENGHWAASGSYTSLSATAGDTASLSFDGRWANIGFYTDQFGGLAEIFVDGVSQGIIGLYSADSDVKNFVVGDLIPGSHTLSVTVLGQPDPPSTQARVRLDYIDVWDGQTMPDDITNASLVTENGRVHLSGGLTMNANPNAIEGDFVSDATGVTNSNVWYGFTGDSFTYYGFSLDNEAVAADVYVDGQFLETVSLAYPFTQQPLAFHYDNLSEGPHVARIHYNHFYRVDAFASNQTPIDFLPLAEWWESDRMAGGSVFGGIHVPVAVGDVTGDGQVELAVASSNWDHQGELFLLNGDGRDAGDGTPIIWSVPFDIPNGFEDVGAPAIAELDGQPGAEIVMATSEGMYAFHSDGSTYWFTDTVKPHVFFGTPAIGNLDLDAEPEIVINMDNTLVVFEQDGSIAWTFNDADGLTMPLLADLTGDGLLDILFHDWNDTLYLYDYNLGNPQLVWSVIFADPLHGYGSPAMSDLDDDGIPEVALATENWLYALNSEDGSIQWAVPLDPGRTGGVTIADLDGDGAVELVTSSLFADGTLYAFEADGTPKWSVPALDTSPLNTSAADLDGDGVFEVLWNGVDQGFTIYDGRTGAILFNEPLASSITGSDVPVAADVDLDGYAEIVVPAQTGLRVFGFDSVWGPARSVWNQLTYHITNIEDDLAVPFSEANSWEGPNTYRAQTYPTSAVPHYQVTLTHTVGVSDVAVLPDTFSVPPAAGADPVYSWEYTQSSDDPAITRSFASVLSGLQPGEAHLVAQGTVVDYTLASGSNRLQLPPLYATVPHIVAVSPATQTVGAGGTAVFEVVLSNMASTADTYTLSVAGLPADWLSYPLTVPVAAGSDVTVSLTVAVPEAADLEEIPFSLNVSNNNGDADQASAMLQIIDGLDVAVDPPEQTAQTGSPVSYTLTLNNLESDTRTYELAASGLANVTLPATVTVAANSNVTLPFQAVTAVSGPHPLTVRASTNTASDSASAILNSIGDWGVVVALSPDTAVGGPGTPAIFSLSVTNTGSQPDIFELTADLPADWDYRFMINGDKVSSLSLTPHVFNQTDLHLLVIPPPTAMADFYDFTVIARSQDRPAIMAAAAGTVEVLPRGVQVALSPADLTLEPTDNDEWLLTVTNTGSVSDSYWLTATGIVANSGQFSTNPVALAPGQTAEVTLSAGPFAYALPTSYPFAVVAASQNDDRILNEATGKVTFTDYEDVQVNWLPRSQTLTNTLAAAFTLMITNTGNIGTYYDLSAYGDSLDVTIGAEQIYIPPHVTLAFTVNAQAVEAGSYTLNGQASSQTSTASALATAVLIFEGIANNDPVAIADEVTTAEDTTATAAVLANDSDPDGDPLTIIAVTPPDHGTVAISSDSQAIIYSPAANYFGSDDFSYTVSDGLGGTDTALATVMVTAVNDPPAALDDTAITPVNVAVTLNVLANDWDVDEDALSLTDITQPTNGSAIINPDNTVTYTPNLDFNGTDLFAYTIEDGNGGTDTAVVTIMVTAINSNPKANDDSATTSEDTDVTILVLSNDIDFDGDPLTVTGLTQPDHGLATLNLDGSVTYYPAANFHGSDSFNYTVEDGQGGSDTAVVTITVLPVNDAPLALDDMATTQENNAITINVLSNDSDVDGDSLSVTTVTTPTQGTVTINADNTLLYSPTAGYQGNDTFTYTVADTGGQTDTALVTVLVEPSGNWQYVCQPGELEVDIIGIGMGSPEEVVNPATLTIPDPENVAYILAQVVVNDYQQVLPEEVILTTDQTSHSLLTPANSDAGYNYELVLPPTSQVTAEVVGDYDGTEPTPRAFILYIFRQQDSFSSSGRLVHHYIHQDSHSQTLTIPAAAFARDVVVTFAVADVDRDARNLILSANAGSVSRQAQMVQANQGDSLLLYELILPDVPSSVTTVTTTVTSPSGTGDSLYWSGIQAAAPCDAVAPPTTRVTEGLQTLYTFQEGSGSTVADVSGVGTPLDLTITDETAVTWLTGGGLSVDTSTIIASMGAATKLSTAAQATNELTLEAWVAPANVSQDGPARIMTLSEDTDLRSFTLGQGLWGSSPKDLFDVRLRTTATDDDGNPSLTSPAGTASVALQHVVYTRDTAGVARLYVDGVEVLSGTVGGDFSNWDDDYVFALANELTGNRPWLGQLHLVAVYNQALTLTQVRQNYLAGSGTLPPAPQANFSAQPVIGTAPLAVTFNNESLYADSYVWDFGDGQTSTAVQPTHTYTQTGSFTVTLAASNGSMSSTLTKIDYVNSQLAATSYSQDFESYLAGDSPTNWLDTAAGNSLATKDSLYEVYVENGNKALGTSSTESNIHSHYVGTSPTDNYIYSGRMMITQADGGVGVTFLSDYAQSDTYYRLRRYNIPGSPQYSQPTFALSAHGAPLPLGTIDTGVLPQANVWYHFKIEVIDTGTQTEIRAKVWAEGTAEPATWQIDAYDDGPNRLTIGTFGVWSMQSGDKLWDDLVVQPVP